MTLCRVGYPLFHSNARPHLWRGRPACLRKSSTGLSTGRYPDQAQGWRDRSKLSCWPWVLCARAGQPRPCLDRALIMPRTCRSRPVHLWTHEDNERSHRLYRSRGFAPTGRTVDGEGEWARTLTKRIAPPHSSVVGDVRLPRSAQTGSLLASHPSPAPIRCTSRSSRSAPRARGTSHERDSPGAAAR